jgi:transcriptional regulator with XRE-family HTH domain
MTTTDSGKSDWRPIVVDLADNLTAQTVAECYGRSGANQEAFAKLMGVSRASLGRWLAGSGRVPPWASRAALFAAIASGVGITVPNPAQYLSPPRKRRSKSK